MTCWPPRRGRLLARIADLGIEYQASGLVTTREYIQSHRDIVERVVKSMIEGVNRFKTDKSFAEKVLAKYLKNSSPQVVDGSYNAYVNVFPEVPAPTKAGMEEILKEDKTAQGKLDVSTTIDTSFVDQLQKDGFIQQLYGK
jgi:ABC-type nitrate/sulfonate/bicarbonate transport system substrate-binding protein